MEADPNSESVKGWQNATLLLMAVLALREGLKNYAQFDGLYIPGYQWLINLLLMAVLALREGLKNYAQFDGLYIPGYQWLINLLLMAVLALREGLKNYAQFDGLYIPGYQWLINLLLEHIQCYAIAGVRMMFCVCHLLAQKNLSEKNSTLLGAFFDLWLDSIFRYHHLVVISAGSFSVPTRIDFMVAQIIITLKMHSYFATNNLLDRQLTLLESNPSFGAKVKDSFYKKMKVQNMYPFNLTVKDFGYFAMVPTLSYETRFPVKKNFDWLAIVQYTLGFVFWFTSMCFAFAQLVLPQLVGRSGNFVYDLIQITPCCFLCWLVFFYAYFKFQLNLCAEWLKFDDKRFYDDWWNSKDLAEFWKKWNIPVHEWCLRHVFVESRYYLKFSSPLAVFSVFFLSAVLHEVIFSYGFSVLRAWGFIGMIIQFPFVVLGRVLKVHPKFGNLNMWVGPMIGNALALIIYFSEFWENNYAGLDVNSLQPNFRLPPEEKVEEFMIP
eukprot:CAMPEP_0115000576 /NCGR_PEP_ID=MMETSP0216-20121206/16844_1 /TAXON_ID=223996 /ORGANISM="Protocruzia adherens, Strain Boccale" /LENGTH=493 /DNA_ID=CAMNT_0002365709 /DNA_START=37 /DNA_END=1520 /DNA_ORIENTATION=+